MKQTSVSSVLVAIILITQCLHHALSTEPDSSERKQRKRADSTDSRRNREQDRRKFRKQLSNPEREEPDSTTPVILELEPESLVDPESLVTIPQPTEPLAIDYGMDMDSHERRGLYIMIQRRKNLRIFQIQQRLLQVLGRGPVINMSKEALENVRKLYAPLIESEGSEYPGPLEDNQELYALTATCKRPRNAHKPTWEDEGLDKRLFFPINITTRKFRRTGLHSAILRLYKPGEQDSESWEETAAAGNETSTEAPAAAAVGDVSTQEAVPADSRQPRTRGHRYRHHHHHTTPEPEPEPVKEEVDEEERLEGGGEMVAAGEDSYSVTVYQYTRALRKNKKEKLELVASVLVSKNHTGWVRIHVKDSAHLWMSTPKKNFGLKVTVEDMEGNKVDFREVFHTTNCSADGNDTVDTKYALVGAFASDDTNMTNVANEATFPTLDLITVTSDLDIVDAPVAAAAAAPIESLTSARATRRRQQRSAENLNPRFRFNKDVPRSRYSPLVHPSSLEREEPTGRVLLTNNVDSAHEQ